MVKMRAVNPKRRSNFRLYGICRECSKLRQIDENNFCKHCFDVFRDEVLDEVNRAIDEWESVHNEQFKNRQLIIDKIKVTPNSKFLSEILLNFNIL